MGNDTIRAIPQRPNINARAFTMPDETLPDPPTHTTAAGAPADKPARPTSLAAAYPWLLKPFAKADVALKPVAMTKDKTRALASAYVDPRAYFCRLDTICGPENWSQIVTLTDRGAVCALTIFGVTKSAAGDYPLDRADENPATSAEMQAFKRACAAFGLGRYLYTLPQVWSDYDAEKKQIVNPGGIVVQMYASLQQAHAKEG